MSETMIKIDSVSKEYRLGTIGGGTLRGDLQSWWAKVRGREDPNLRIGQKAYTGNERFLALDDISFEVKRGEALGIIGHNGAGKSTLLKLLSRVTAPTKGTISYNGRIASMLEVGTGFHPELTGRENIYMNGAILGMTKAEITRKMDEIIAFAEMEKFIDTPVKRYSSGMYVKLAFSVAAHLDSEIMIMDEVLAVGDMKFQQKCLGKMGDAAENDGRTVLYVSHNMNTIRQLCTRCAVLDHGRLVYIGAVDEAIDIYMNRVGNMQQTEFDLSQKSQYNDPALVAAKTITLKLLNKEAPIFKCGEMMDFQVSLLARKNIEHLRFRFEIRYADDTTIGVMPEIDLGHFDKDSVRTFQMQYDTSLLARGKYQVYIVLFEKNDFGTGTDIDIVAPAFYFEMQDNGSILWNDRQWGHVKFPTLPYAEV